MGLHVWYELGLRSPATFDDAIEAMTRLHEFAQGIGFTGDDHFPAVSELEIGGPGDQFPEMLDGIAATCWVRFTVMPGRGCETAHFSLAERPTGGPQAFAGSLGFCKTQYAHGFGREHFLACHRGLIALLDRARELGVLSDVRDDGGYWNSRSVESLMDRLAEHQRVVAAFAGCFKDAIERQLGANAGVVIAPITKEPTFEHLEAEGRSG